MIIRWKAVSMEQFTGEFNNRTVDIILKPNGWRVFVDNQPVKLKPFKTAKKAQNFTEERAQNVIRTLMIQQDLLAQQQANALQQAA